MASFEVNGTLKVKKDTQVVSDKFSKREFVITTDLTSQYPQYISLQLTQDKCALLDSFQVGDEMKVSFNLRGREWNGPEGVKFFNSLEAWRLERAGATQQATPQASSPSYANEASVMQSENAPNDDLPF
ncbi:MAG: DUF3127 domain-containing protein [Bacteroidetes bacterium]|nr:DUF3127 domain-containing protein [Bacteroidota bacterium]